MSGGVAWVADDSNYAIHAVRVRDGARVTSPYTRTALRAAGISEPYAIATDGATMWVSDRSTQDVRAFSHGTTTRQAEKDVPGTLVRGINSRFFIRDMEIVGQTLFVADSLRGVYAFTVA